MDTAGLNAAISDVSTQLNVVVARLRSTPADQELWDQVRVLGAQGAGLAKARMATGVPLPDMRYPEGRLGWLGPGQPWPCGRCGNEADGEDRHDCQPPAVPVDKPLVGPGAIDGGK